MRNAEFGIRNSEADGFGQFERDGFQIIKSLVGDVECEHLAVGRDGQGVEEDSALDLYLALWLAGFAVEKTPFESGGEARAATALQAGILDLGAQFLGFAEDGLAEDDWEAWPQLAEKLNGRAITLGDDLLCTNPVRIARAIASRSANALLLKVNQIGT